MIPEPNDIYYPVSRSKGTYVVVLESVEDRVRFRRHDLGQDDHEQTVRLSTFLSRFEESGYSQEVPAC